MTPRRQRMAATIESTLERKAKELAASIRRAIKEGTTHGDGALRVSWADGRLTIGKLELSLNERLTT